MIKLISELRQLPSSLHRAGLNQIRHGQFGVAVAGGVDIQKPRYQSPRQTCSSPTQHHEARARQLCCAIEIHNAERRSKIPMRLRSKGKRGLLAPLRDDFIIAAVFALWHTRQTCIGQMEKLIVKLFFQRFALLINRLGLIAELPRTLFRGTNVLAIFGRHANRFTRSIDLSFGRFKAGFQFANLVIERQ